MNIQTLKGFRDFLPKEARKRQYVINTFKKVFESYGFEPLETPALEYEELLMGKYGEEGDKLMYRFEDNGKRRVALRYDQTVPTARVVAQYQNDLPMPFKRYQIQPVWRAENTQKGRYREFLQCDIDIIGISTPLADAELLTAVASSIKKLGFKKFKILINDRNVFKQLTDRGTVEVKNLPDVIRTVDKIKKIGREGVLNELGNKGYSTEVASYILQSLETQKVTPLIAEIFKYMEDMGVDSTCYEFYPLLARGLDYYTGIIFEVEIEGYTAGSVCGGGRYDNLIGMFAGKKVPATGCAFGFDRIMEAMEEANVFPANLETTKVLVTVFSEELANKSLEIASRLRAQDINTEIYLEPSATMEKQLKYADAKNVPYVVIVGEQEIANNTVILKDMQKREQKQISIEELVQDLLPARQGDSETSSE